MVEFHFMARLEKKFALKSKYNFKYYTVDLHNLVINKEMEIYSTSPLSS